MAARDAAGHQWLAMFCEEAAGKEGFVIRAVEAVRGTPAVTGTGYIIEACNRVRGGHLDGGLVCATFDRAAAHYYAEVWWCWTTTGWITVDGRSSALAYD